MASSNYTFMGNPKHIPICSKLPYQAVVNSNIKHYNREDKKFCGVINSITVDGNLIIGMYGSFVFKYEINKTRYHNFRLTIKDQILNFNFPDLITEPYKTEIIHNLFYDIEKIYLKRGGISEENDISEESDLIYESAIKTENGHTIVLLYIAARLMTPEMYTKLDEPEDIAALTELWNDLMTWYSDSKTLLAPPSNN